MDIPEKVDVVVCGGGPGGSTAATVLARAGRSVALFEREKFPRFHIGESLLPLNVPLFERIGVLQKVQAWGPQVKMGARFYHQGTEYTRPVLFARSMTPQFPSAFQVKRAEFDQLLLEHSRSQGATVFEGARVEEVLFEGERAVGVRVKLEGEKEPRVVKASCVVDATGRDALLSKRLGGRLKDPSLDRTAVFAHFDTFDRAPGPEGGDIVVVTTPDGWWWLIPFSDGGVSVGIVAPSTRFKARAGSAEDYFAACIEGSPQVKAMLAASKRTTDVKILADYSYTLGRFKGDGFCCVGDAACFLDPVFSSGVLLAMTSGELAANAIHGALAKKGRVDERDFARYEKAYRRGTGRFSQFVHGFYEPAMLETFYTPSPNPVIERAVTSVLAGDVFFPDFKTQFWLGTFTACVWGTKLVQRFRGLGPWERATGLVRAGESPSA